VLTPAFTPPEPTPTPMEKGPTGMPTPTPTDEQPANPSAAAASNTLAAALRVAPENKEVVQAVVMWKVLDAIQTLL
jgi:hypothetical protein